MAPSHRSPCWVVLSLLALVLVPTWANTKYDNAYITDITPRQVGYKGGQHITIRGVGFDREGQEGATTVYVGTDVCETIAYYSSDTQIVCVMPEVTVVESYLAVTVSLWVAGGAMGSTAICETSCSVRARSVYTPTISESQLAAPPGGNVTLIGYLRGITADEFELRLNGTLLETAYESDDVISTSSWNTGRYDAVVPSMTAGYYNVSFLVNRQDSSWGAGFSANYNSVWLAHKNTTYDFEVHPVVSALSASAAGTLGGALLTVYGDGFDADACVENNVVSVAGVNCVPVACTNTEITCRLEAVVGVPESDLPRGLAGSIFSNSLGTWTPAPAEVFNFTQTSGAHHYMRDFDTQYRQVLEGYFVPEATGDHRFFCQGDDRCYFDISTDESVENMTDSVAYSTYATSYWNSNNQISDPIPLVAGRRYRCRIRHIQYGGGDFFKVGMHVSSPDVVLSPNEILHESLRERQIIEFTSDVVREQHELVFNNVYNGTFYLTLDGQWTTAVDLDSPSALADAFEDISDCGSISASEAAGLVPNQRRIIITYSCPTTMARDLPQIYTSADASLTPANRSLPVSYRVNRYRAASEPIRGTYQLGYKGNWTRPLAYSCDAGCALDALIEVSELQEISGGSSGNSQDGMTLTFSIYLPTGNLSQIEVNSSGLTGANVTARAYTQEHGAHELFHEIIPGRYFRRFYNDSDGVVVVTTNGLRSSCADLGQTSSACAFAFDAQRNPSINTVSNSGDPSVLAVADIVTISGAGFGLDEAAIAVTFNDIPASIVQVSDTEVICEVPHISAGPINIELIRAHVGRAANHDATAWTYAQAVDAVGPLTGPVAGNLLLNIAGTGFPASPAENNVTVGGQPCVVQSAQPDSLTCILPPAWSDLDTREADLNGTLNATIVINGEAFTNDFVYDWSLTPVLTAVTPSAIPSAVTTLVTLAGSWPSVGSLDLSGAACAVPAGLAITVAGRACHDATLINATHLTCSFIRADGRAFGEQQGLVPRVDFCLTSGNLWRAHTQPTVRVDLNHRVTAISPARFGTAGGARITITGAGFGQLVNSVGVEAKNVSGSNVPCLVDYVSDSQVECVMAEATGEAHDCELELQINGFVARCSPGTCVVDFLSNLTAAILPSTERPSVGWGDVVTLTTERVWGNPSVTVGGVPAVVQSYSETAVTFEVPALSAGAHDVALAVAPYGRASGMASLGYRLSVDGLSQLSGSVAGGSRVVLVGEGFPTDPTALAVSFVHAGSGNNARRAAVLSTNMTLAEVVIPYLINEGTAHSETYELALTVTNSSTFQISVADAADLATVAAANCTNPQACAFFYNASETPVLTAIQPTTGAAGTVLTLTGSNFFAEPRVHIAGVACTVLTANSSLVTCTVGEVRGGSHLVEVEVTPFGMAMGIHTFAATATVDSMSPAIASYAGGTLVTLHGHGFGPADAVSITVGTKSCDVVNTTYNQVLCRAPEVLTPLAVAYYAHVEPVVLPGTMSYEQLLDRDYSTYVSNCCNREVDFALPEDQAAVLTRVRFFPRLKYESRSAGGQFYASPNGTHWVLIAEIADYHAGWNSIDVSVDFPVTHIRYTNERIDMAEFEFQGHVVEQAMDEALPVVTRIHPAALPNSMVVHDAATAPGPADAYIAPGVQNLTYATAQTPEVNAIRPTWGTALGGTKITVLGLGLTAVSSVTINTYPCSDISVVSDSLITCVTTRRSTLTALSVEVEVDDGSIAVNQPTARFRYMDRWSQVNTWVNDEPPIEGDTVVIPADQVVLMDVTPPKLFLLLVQGQLIFEDMQDLELHASYIWVQGGLLEVGTEDVPFQHRATITLYGDRWNSIGLPHLGAKCLVATNAANYMGLYGGHDGAAVPATLRGVIDIHGIPRRRTWTKVAQTVAIGDTQIFLSEEVDFAPGETIILTSHTNYKQTEELVVAARSVDNRVLTVTSPVQYEHQSFFYEAAGERVDMRIEVGLISRNIVVQGEPGASEKQNFGSHLMAARGAMLRLENAELRRCGQAGVLGRYCSHFHLGGSLPDSYIKSNSIHHSFQRAVTVHGTHNALVQNNVAYFVKGHTIFVEDGDEFFNVIDANLVARTEKLHVMLKGDQKPASFWMASPSNLWRNNVAAGCVNDGFWFELPSNPHGPSYTTSICPVHGHLIEFRNNTAHANGVHGLRIYPVYLPYVDPCDESSGPAPQYYHNFTTFNNGEHGIFGKENGDLHHINVKSVGNGREEIFWTKLHDVEYRENDPHIVNSLFVNHVDPSRPAHTVGLFMPQNEYFHVAGAKFVNYGAKGTLSACAKCDTQTNFRQGGYTFRLQGLEFFNSTKRAEWTSPFKQIFYDLDGSLTGFVNGTATPFHAFNHYPGVCDAMGEAYDFGLVCDNTVRVRRLQIDAIEPDELDDQALRLAQVANASRSGTIGYRVKEIGGWVAPVVNNREYDLGLVSLIDFRSMRIRYSERHYLQYDDELLLLNFNYTDYRYDFEVVVGDAAVEQPSVSLIDTLGATSAYGTGRIVPNEKHWSVALTARPADPWDSNPFMLVTHAIQCAPGRCGFFTDLPLYDPTLWTETKYWCRNSVTKSATYARWYSAEFTSEPSCDGDHTLPLAGDQVEIGVRMYVVMNINPPAFSHMDIAGKLQFDDSDDRMLEANTISVWGELQVGSSGKPFEHEGVVRLHGQRTSDSLIIDDTHFLGNKVMAVLGTVSMYGQPRTAWVRLAATAMPGDLAFNVTSPVDWVSGDEIVISSTEYDASETETHTVAAVSTDGLMVTMTSAMAHRHFAGDIDGGAQGTQFLAAAVGLLNRNVRFEGAEGANEGSNYGAHVVAMDVNIDGNVKVASTEFSDVEFRSCGQQNMEHACIFYKYDRSYTAANSPSNVLHNSVLHNSNNYGIETEGAPNVTITDSVIHRTYRSALKLDATTMRFVMTGSLVVDNRRSPDASTDWVVPYAGLYAETYSVTLRDNVFAGMTDTGMMIRPNSCGDADRATITNNEVHSTLVGVFLMADAKSCFELRGATVWKAAHLGIVTVDQRAEVQILNSVVSDSHIGISLNFFTIAKRGSEVLIENSLIMGATAASTCDDSLRCRAVTGTDVQGTGSTCGSVFGNSYRHVGVVLPQYTNRGKTCEQDYLPSCRPVTRPERLCGMGWEARYGLPSVTHAHITMRDVTFAHFNNRSSCNLKSYGILTNPTQRNYAPEQQYTDVTFYETDAERRFYFGRLPEHSSECQTGCDALTYLLAHESNGELSGLSGAGTITSNVNPGVILGEPFCTSLPSNGASRCGSDSMRLRHAVLINRDRDSGFRRIGPVNVQRMKADGVNATERVTSSEGPFSDNCAKRFYFGQHPFVIDAAHNIFKVNTSNDFPANARIEFVGQDVNDRAHLKIRVYVTNLDMRLVHNGVEKEPLGAIPDVNVHPVGTYTFDARNTFHLIVGGTGHHIFDIRTLSIVRLNLTVTMSLDEFFDPSQIVSNLAILLDIPSSRIKVVGVHDTASADARRRATGSKVLALAIGDQDNGTSTVPTTDEEEENQNNLLDELMNNITAVVTSGALKTKLNESGVRLDGVTMAAPASAGLEASRATPLNIEPTTAAPSLSPGTGSSNDIDPAAVAGAVCAGAVLAVIVVLLTVRHRRETQRRAALAKAEGQTSDGSEAEGTLQTSQVTVLNMDAHPVEVETMEGRPAPSSKPGKLARSGSFFGRLLRSGSSNSVGPTDDSKDTELQRMESRRGLNPLRSEDIGVPDEREKLSTLKRIKMPTDEVHRVIPRKTWEYVGSGGNDYWHPKLSAAQAQEIIMDKPQGTFLLYGRKPVILCVKTGKNTARHDALEFHGDLGFRIQMKREQPFHGDLSTLIAYYAEPREGVPYTLNDYENNDIHFNVPSASTRLTTSEERGVGLPEYTDEDLTRLDRRTSMRLRRAKDPIKEDEVVTVDPRYVRRPSLRTRASVKEFEPLILSEVDDQ
ncbi:uncharacterized protein MONBRDRAFT_22411 [Monosiga brevicollis MX1]|uniref:Fibrocystin-L n=1 Tax=Monosiga brevicollis TaxID=81824 RepID=A9UQH9_MONBE|nr:uncharacterized protein MONBRDRAFT_22411 [Monosiga brevicollis MX1]EDQ93048.1 predicted protein [Monosiga brevicollis MX1]|eukprot:XP_001742810.1 hypothetical protein [Monosiga brevicollis MX1]